MLTINYILFAIIATSVNLFVQYCSFWLYSGNQSLYIAIFLGTVSGLIVKYFLDKKWIFKYRATSKKDDAEKFALYALMGIFTTAIFWLTEIAFDFTFQSEYAKYIGAVIGLGIGYLLKYNLDRKYVFGENLS